MSCISIDTERLLFRMNLCIVSIAFNGYTVLDRTRWAKDPKPLQRNLRWWHLGTSGNQVFI